MPSLTRLNNRSISAVTALPSGIDIPAGVIVSADLPAGTLVGYGFERHSSQVIITASNQTYTNIRNYTYTPKFSGSIVQIIHTFNIWWGSVSDGESQDFSIRYNIGGSTVYDNQRIFGNISQDKKYTHAPITQQLQYTTTSTSQITMTMQGAWNGTAPGTGLDFFHGQNNNTMLWLEFKQ